MRTPRGGPPTSFFQPELLASDAAEQRYQVVGVFLFHGQDFLEHPARGRILVAEVIDDFFVAVDRNTLRDQVLLDHVGQFLALDILRMTARAQPIRRQVRLAAELHYALRDAVRMSLFLARVLQEFCRYAVGADAAGHEVMTLVAQHAHDFGCKRFIADLDNGFTVCLVALGYRTLLDMTPRTLTQYLDVGQKRLLLVH